MSEYKFCIDCKHISKSLMYCRSPRNGMTLVDGSPKVRLAQVNRGETYFNEETCGQEGKWWESEYVAFSAPEHPSSLWQRIKTYFN